MKYLVWEQEEVQVLSYALGTLSGSIEEKLPPSKVWPGFGTEIPTPLRTAVNTSTFDQ